MTYRSLTLGTTNRTRSSAYRLVLLPTLSCRGVRSCCCSTHFRKWLRTSMVSTNNIGESGSPWRRLRAWQIRLPERPLSRIFVLVVAKIIEIQSLHRWPKPMCWRTSRRNGHETVSKAFAISILSKMVGDFFSWMALQAICTFLKLSWMWHPLMKALWLRRTRASRTPASLLAKHLVMSLLKLCMRLIGR